MAKANQVSVDIVAQVEGYKAALAAASQATNQFSSQIKSALGSVQEPFAQLSKQMAAVGAIAAGGAVFHSFVTAALEAASGTKQLAINFGIAVADASNLRVALELMGISTDEYTQAARQLDRQVRTNGESLERHGLAIKDSNGKLLDQQTLMRNAAQWVLSFKAGTDQAIASQVAFGRGVQLSAQQLEKLAQISEKAKKDAEELGLGVTPEDIERAKQYKIAMAELEQSFNGIKKAIGEAILPYLTFFAQKFREMAPAIRVAMKETVTAVVNGAINMAEAIVRLAGSLVDLKAAFDSFKNAAAGGFSAAANAVVPGFGLMTKAFNEAKAAFDRFNASAGAKGGKDTADGKGKVESSSVQATIDALERFRAAVLGSKEQFGPPIPPKPGRSAEELEKGGDKKADEIKKLRAERAKIIADADVSAEEEKNQQLLALGKITDAQFLQAKLAAAKQRAAIDDQALTNERNAFPRYSADWEKAENARVKASEKAALDIQKINNQIVLEQQKNALALASSINSAIESGMEKALTAWEDGTKKMKDVWVSFAKSLQSALNQYAVKSLIGAIMPGAGAGGAGGAGGIGGLFASLIGLGGHAIGGTVLPGQFAIAGEQGPELIYGGQGGASVTPNSAMSMRSQPQDININVSGATTNSEIRSMVSQGIAAATPHILQQSAKQIGAMQTRYA